MKKDVYRLVGIAAALIAVVAIAAIFYLRAQKQQRAELAAKQPPPETSILVRSHSHSLGPANAKVTVVEFLDPECESCRAIYPAVKNLLAQYGDRVRLVVRYMPLHGNSRYAASALEAAAEQNRFWEMLEILFANQPRWGSHHDPRPQLIPDYAQQIGLDMAAFNRSISKPAHKALIDIDEADGKKLGVTGTPTFLVNGRLLERLDYAALQALIEEELAKK